MEIFSGFCFGFALASWLNTRLDKGASVKKLLNSISVREKHKAIVPGKPVLPEPEGFWD